MLQNKNEAYDRVHTTVIKSKFNTLAECLFQHTSTEDIRLAYQHCGGVLSKSKDKKRTTLTAALIDEFAAHFTKTPKYGIGDTEEI